MTKHGNVLMICSIISIRECLEKIFSCCAIRQEKQEIGIKAEKQLKMLSFQHEYGFVCSGW